MVVRIYGNKEMLRDITTWTIKWKHIYVRIGAYTHDIDGLVQDCINSSALALELLQSCSKPSIYGWYNNQMHCFVSARDHTHILN